MYSLVRANSIAWDKFREYWWPGPIHWGNEREGGIPTRPHGDYYGGFESHPTDEEAAEWRLWISEVFMPMNLRMEEIIVQHAGLLVEKEMPDCLLILCAHVAAYKSVLKKWESGDFSRHTSVLRFPREALFDYTEEAYKRLKTEQSELLGTSRKEKRRAKYRRRG